MDAAAILNRELPQSGLSADDTDDTDDSHHGTILSPRP